MQSRDSLRKSLEKLVNQELAGVLHDADYIEGLIFAVCAAPEIPLPDKWLVWAFDTRGKLASTHQADRVAEILMGLFQEQLRHMRNEHIALPSEFTFPEQPGAPASQWLSGLLAGHRHLEPVWQTAWDHKVENDPDAFARLKRDLTHCLKMFSTFADVPLAINQAERVGNQGLIDSLPAIFLSTSAALQKYVGISGELVAALPDQFETFTQPAE